jgi:two-component system response regulator PilR (NtrC family)
MADDERIGVEDLRLPAQPNAPAPPAQPAAAPQPPSSDPRTLNPYDTASSRLPEYMELLERKAIEQALQENRYNKTKTASALGITFRALRYKLKKLGID